jgi:hypothetical protein
MSEDQQQPFLAPPQRGPKKPQQKPRVYRVVSVTRFGRTSHIDYHDAETAFMTYENKRNLINFMFVAIFRDGHLLLNDTKEYVESEEEA